MANTHSSTEIISVIVPLFNEEDNVKPLCLELNEALNSIKYPYEVIFIDDGSNDKTSENLSEFIKINQYFHIITLSRNSGQTQAIMAGIDRVII